MSKGNVTQFGTKSEIHQILSKNDEHTLQMAAGNDGDVHPHNDSAQTPGGISMDGRKINLAEDGSLQLQFGTDGPITFQPLEGFMPRIGTIVAVAPDTALGF